MAAAAILDCRIHKILLAGSVRRAQTHHSTKFHQNWSFHCGDIAILQIFRMAAAAIMDFRNREILLAIVVERVQTHQHAKFRQNRSIGWILPPSWIFEIAKFYCLLWSRAWRRISKPNFVKIGQSVPKVLRFFDFQDGGRRHLGFSKSWIFISWRSLEGSVASLYQILSKLVSFFAEILWLFEFSRWPSPPSSIFEIAKF